MTQIEFHYTHKPEWMNESAKKMGANLVNDKIMTIPKALGHGQIYFTRIIPGVSIVVLDAIFTTKTIINKLRSDKQLHILQFDLSNSVNQIEINKVKYPVGHTINLGFASLNSQDPVCFLPKTGKRVYTLHLLIDNNLLNEYIINETPKKGAATIRTNRFFQNHIDSNSKILALSLKEKSMSEIAFDTYIQGITLKILANFINTYTKPASYQISKNEINAIIKTKHYLINNLYEQFPSITLLSKIAGMSTTKYKLLFKSINHISPNQFFIKEKLILANKLLRSKKFSSPIEIIQMMNYSKVSYFKARYFEYFGRKPSDDFIKSEN